MALFQPTNIIPSSFTIGVVDAIQDVAQISWQVNGNSAMTAYKIDFYKNGEDSTPILIYSTGKESTGIPVGGFYGTDRFGQPKMFTWMVADNKTWNAYNPEFKNGERFMFQITQYWQSGESEQEVSPIDFNVFNTKTTPHVAIFLSDKEYQTENELENGTALSSSIGYFKAQYEQEQGDAIRWARWQIATASYSSDQWQIDEIISDTGEVNTPILQFEFNGFFNEQNYAVRCFVESDSGQQAVNSLSTNDGWIFFSIQTENHGEYRGDFTLRCLPKENAALLSWAGEEIPPVVNGSYSLGLGKIHLQNSSMRWGKSGNFSSPWTAVIQFDLKNREDVTYGLIAPYYPAQITKTFNSKGLIQAAMFQAGVRGIATIAPNKKSCTISYGAISRLGMSSSYFFEETPFAPTGELMRIEQETESDISIKVDFDTYTRKYQFLINDVALDMSSITPNDQYGANPRITLALTSEKVILYVNGKRFTDRQLSYQQTDMKSIQIGGLDNSDVTYRCVSVYKGTLDDATLDKLYAITSFKPTWDDIRYELHMTANFNGDIDGGEITTARIYRQEIGTNILIPLYYARNNSVLALKDFGIRSRKSYTYWLYEYDKNNGYLKGAQCTLPGSKTVATISTNFKNFSLLVCDYDSENDAYHVRKQYLFALNLSAGSEGNNNSPTINKNFTPYPTRMPDTANYISGTLQGLIGAIYTVPALIEQISGFKHTSKPSTLDYFDSVDLEKELYDLSVAPYQLFIRDMKGRLRMVATNGAISMTTNLKQRQQAITISFPWVEIGDASDVIIIQTPDDYGWNNDEQVLDVHLDVDPATGILTANYPKPYNGTKFYLTGAQKEILAAKTPLGATPAQFSLSETAEKPDDGTLAATTTRSTEAGD